MAPAGNRAKTLDSSSSISQSLDPEPHPHPHPHPRPIQQVDISYPVISGAIYPSRQNINRPAEHQIGPKIPLYFPGEKHSC